MNLIAIIIGSIVGVFVLFRLAGIRIVRPVEV